MALTCGFFDSLDHDRMYNALQFGSIFDGVINDGVYKNFLNGMRVEAGGVNRVRVLSGRAWFDHSWTLNTSTRTYELPKSELRFNRYDMVVIDVNWEREVRNNDIVVIKGESGVHAVKPKPLRSPSHNQYPLAYIYRKAGKDNVEQSDIISAIGTSECPYASLSKGVGGGTSSGSTGSTVVEEEETIDDAQGNPLEGSNGLFLTSSIKKPVEIPIEPDDGGGGGSGGSGCTCDPVDPIPVDWMTDIFSYGLPSGVEIDRMFLDAAGLQSFVNAIKNQNFGSGGGSGSGGSGTGVCLGDENTFSINTIPNEWAQNIFSQGLPSDHANCAHFLDSTGLLEYTQAIKKYVDDAVKAASA